MSSTQTKIAQIAESFVASRNWMKSVARGDFPKNTNKCNLFVYEVLVAAGVKPKPRVPKYLVLSRPPTAAEWADPKTRIQSWDAVKTPSIGDVIAEAHNYSDATGHVGIVVGKGLTVSASANVGGIIVKNDWGFRAKNNPSFKTYNHVIIVPPAITGPKY